MGPQDPTKPRTDELDRLMNPLPPELARLAAQATEPDAAEVHALQRRLRSERPSRAPLRWSVAAAAVFALALVFALFMQNRPLSPKINGQINSTFQHHPTVSETTPVAAPTPRPSAEPSPDALAADASTITAPARRPRQPQPAFALGPLTLDATTVALNPSISVSGSGRARLLAVGSGGTVLALDDGLVQAEVDPTGAERRFAVVAGDVTVEVVGTIFSVRRDAATVTVEVQRGHVRVTDPSGERTLNAGDRWSNLPDVASSARAYAALVDRASRGERDAALWSDLVAFEAENPTSPLASEAALLRLSQQSQALPAEEVVTGLDAWLARWPAAPGADEAHWLRATLLRGLDRCDMAASSYAALAAGGGPRAAAAKAWLADCAED